MKNNFIKRVMALSILSVSLLGVSSVQANAEWRQDNVGWWYSQGNTYLKNTWFYDNATGKQYYFGNDGYMAKNTTVGSYRLGYDGAWIQTTQPIANNTSVTNNIQTSKVYSVGEKWIVDGQWEFTINSVKTTEERNKFWDDNPNQVVVINYSYKNLGYVGDIQDLYMRDFIVMDEKGVVSKEYPTITDDCTPTPIGAICDNAEIGFGLKNESNYVTIQVEHYRGGKSTQKEKATFKIPVE